MTTMQRVYKFGGGVASPDVTEGDASMNYILGGKGANLAEMCRIGLPVPPGFTITCQTCVEYDEAGNSWPDGALDEIEAALDDVNVVKYAQYLRTLCDKTQFITITHRRGTMEEADVLYGVTMQEEGVSKLLELNVGEIEGKLGIQ